MLKSHKLEGLAELDSSDATTAFAPAEPSKRKQRFVRWGIVLMLFLAAVLNYIDRSVLGLLAPTIQRDLKISDPQYASVVNCFLIAYTIAYLLSGRIVDRIGEKVSMALFIVWWSISNALTGFAHSVRSLSMFRFLLGLGEAGSFTVAPKVVSIWFAPKERGMAIGLYSIGGAIGATVAPLIVTSVSARFGWRWVFGVTPILAFLWVAVWLKFYRRPNAEEGIETADKVTVPNKEVTAPSEAAIWQEVLRLPLVWRLMGARLLTDPVWYFYQFWMAKYLYTSRHLDQKQLSIMWMIFVAADIGFLAGGILSGVVIRKGVNPPAARLWLMFAAACLTPLSAFIPGAPNVTWVVGIAVVVAYGLTSWLSNLTALVVDIVPQRILGTSFGVIACGSALGGIAMNQVVSWLVTHRSYSDCFYLMALVHPAAILLVWTLRRRTN